MNKEKTVDGLLKILKNNINVNFTLPEKYEDKRTLFRNICTVSYTLDNVGEEFYKLQDELLKEEVKEKGVIDTDKLEYKDSISLWQGDITRLKVDAIVNAANDEYMGCFVPGHLCIDNVIINAAGFQVREELLKLKSDKNYNNMKVKVTKAYNLPCKFIFHIAGPIVYGVVTEKNMHDLAECYTNCLDRAKEMGLKSIAFCCLSTGEFCFPNEDACKIAVKTVQNWIKNNDYDIKIIFNVFKDVDRRLYEQQL